MSDQNRGSGGDSFNGNNQQPTQSPFVKRSVPYTRLENPTPPRMTFTYDGHGKRKDSWRSNDIVNNGFNSSRGYAPTHFVPSSQ